MSLTRPCGGGRRCWAEPGGRAEITAVQVQAPRRIPVVQDAIPVGIVSIGDLALEKAETLTVAPV